MTSESVKFTNRHYQPVHDVVKIGVLLKVDEESVDIKDIMVLGTRLRRLDVRGNTEVNLRIY